jgi:hypothetical protein
MLVKRGKLPSITNRLQDFINRCSRCIINIRWPEIISNEDLWKITNQQPTAIQKKKEKMGLDRPYPKKTHRIHREVGIGLEPSVCKQTANQTSRIIQF